MASCSSYIFSVKIWFVLWHESLQEGDWWVCMSEYILSPSIFFSDLTWATGMNLKRIRKATMRDILIIFDLFSLIVLAEGDTLPAKNERDFWQCEMMWFLSVWNVFFQTYLPTTERQSQIALIKNSSSQSLGMCAMETILNGSHLHSVISVLLSAESATESGRVRL